MSQAERTRRVLDDVERERASQIGRGYTEDHDDQHGTGALLALVPHYTKPDGDSWPEYRWSRERLIMAAALLVAAVETMDRRHEGSGA